jgi:hypothetical protein
MNRRGRFLPITISVFLVRRVLAAAGIINLHQVDFASNNSPTGYISMAQMAMMLLIAQLGITWPITTYRAFDADLSNDSHEFGSERRR